MLIQVLWEVYAKTGLIVEQIYEKKRLWRKLARDLREVKRAVWPYPSLFLVKESEEEGRLNGRVLEGSAGPRKFDKNNISLWSKCHLLEKLSISKR